MKTALITTAVALLCGFSSLAASAQDSPWQIRFRGLAISPAEQANSSSIGGFAEVDEGYTPQLDITYFLDDNWSFELIAATAEHGVRVRDTAVGDVNLGSVWILPPTLTLQYHFGDTSWKARPYLGAGINYTLFYSSDEAENSIATNVDYSDNFAIAFQGGVDIPVADQWHLNFDVKYIELETDVDVNNGLATANVAINPWVFGVGFGYRF